MAEEVHISVRFPDDLAHKARVVAAWRGHTRSDLIRQAVREFLATVEPRLIVAGLPAQPIGEGQKNDGR